MPVKTVPDRRATLMNEVVVGHDRFLFHRFNHAFEQLCAASTADDAQLQRWMSLIETRRAWCQARGMTLITLIVPERHVVYQDLLPEGWKISADRPVARILDMIDPEVKRSIVYPDGLLNAARHDGETFYRTDTHMTSFGAFHCYQELHAALQSASRDDRLGAAVALETLERSTSRFLGDLGVRVDDEADEEIELLNFPGGRSARKIFSNRRRGNGKVEIHQGENAGRPRAIIFGNSHTLALLPYLNVHFSRLVEVQSWRFFHDLVRKEQPEFVIMQINETQLGEPVDSGDHSILLPDDFDTVSFREFCGEDIPEVSDVHAAYVLDFCESGNGALACREGWSTQEPTQVWSVGGSSILEMPAQSPEYSYLLLMEMSPHIIPAVRDVQRLSVHIGNLHLGHAELSGEQVVAFTIPAGLLSDGKNWTLTLIHPDAIAPISSRPDADTRMLAHAMRRIEIRRA